MGVPFDVNETCGKVSGGFATLATPGSAGRKAKPTRLPEVLDIVLGQIKS
jgi:hypothetical protein